jgi:hypothetical protein
MLQKSYHTRSGSHAPATYESLPPIQIGGGGMTSSLLNSANPSLRNEHFLTGANKLTYTSSIIESGNPLVRYSHEPLDGAFLWR